MSKNDAIDRLRTLRVADIMSPNVYAVGAHRPMAEVAREFLEHEISAAPVIDEYERFVGILTATDFLKRDADLDQHQLEKTESEKHWEIPDPGPDMPSSFMTKAVQTVSVEDSILRAALIMSTEHIHRLPVLDSEQRVAGIVSTMDITAAVVNIVDELDTDLLKRVAAAEPQQ